MTDITAAEVASHMNIDESLAANMLHRQEQMERFEGQLAKDHPDLPFLTRVVMAQDMGAAEDAEAEFRAGTETFERAMTRCGSYTRLDFGLRMVEAGLVPLPTLLDRLVDLWPGCDPDDTDDRFVQLWRLAYQRKGSYLRDGAPLPKGKRFTVYRGQPPGAPLGCAWSLDKDIAERFARGAWARTALPEGELLTLTVPRSLILAYLTRRNESEVILDPKWLSRVEPA